MRARLHWYTLRRYAYRTTGAGTYIRKQVVRAECPAAFLRWFNRKHSRRTISDILRKLAIYMAENKREVIGELHEGERIIPARNIGELSVKLDLDASDAIKALKAVQREAREATKALRELETYYEEEGKRFYTKWLQSGDGECTDIREICMSDIPTKYLSRELAKRDGVVEYVVNPHEGAHLRIGEMGPRVGLDGPARIIVNKD